MISKKKVYLNVAISMIFMVVFCAIQFFYRGKDIDASIVGSGTGAFLMFLLSIIFEKPKGHN
jgi:hypothetical protein